MTAAPHGPRDTIRRLGWPTTGVARFVPGEPTTVETEAGAVWVYSGMTPDGPVWTLLDDDFQTVDIGPDGTANVSFLGFYR